MTLDFTIAIDLKVPIVLAASKTIKTEKTPLLDLISDNHMEIISQLNQYGAIIFRGFSCADADYFSNAIEQCGLGSRCSTADYDLPRTLLPDNIYTSSDLPAFIPLPLHHEKPRSKKPPHHIYFCCVTPPKKGGGTIFANAEAIWLDIPPSIQDKIIEHGVIYKQFLHGKSIQYVVLKKILGNKGVRRWSEYFGSDVKAHIENKLASDDVNWNWVNQGTHLVLFSHLPGARTNPITNKLVWFNASSYLNYYSKNSYEKQGECSLVLNHA